MTTPARHRVAIVGAGVGGLGLAMRLAATGDDYVVLEQRGDGIGGTWRHNTYPGAACDVPSHLYSYADRPNPYWSRSYARQPEILEYLERCADDSGVRPRIRTGWEVASAVWDDAGAAWTVTSTSGERVVADLVVFATGMFDAPRMPDIEGIGELGRPLLHSARWDHSIDLAGKRVGIIGTGASAIQIFPEVAKIAAHTTLFQRTAPYVIPRPDVPFTPEEQERFATDPAALAKARHDLYEMFEGTVAFRLDTHWAEVLKDLARQNLEEHVADPDLRARLTAEYPLGCNRTLVSTEFYEVLGADRADIDLVTDGIARVVPGAVETLDGTIHEVDVLVLATGFQVGEYLHGIDVVGHEGARLHDRWKEYPHAYLGMTVTDFPNLFVFYGPNTNQGGNSIILILEAQAQYVCSALELMQEQGIAAVDVRREVLDAYDRELSEAMAETVWSTGCQSYFIGETGRVVTQLPQTSAWYADRTATFDAERYELEPRT